MEKEINAKEEMPAIAIIQKIKNGQIEATSLNKGMRQVCVEAMMLEGYSQSQIAQILKKCERTIKRDLAEIAERNALSPSGELSRQIIGDVILKAKAHHTYLMRLARDKEAKVAEKVLAESNAWKVIKETTELFQSLGFLPLRPKEIVGNIYCETRSLDDTSLKAINAEVIEMEKIAQEAGALDDETRAAFEVLKHQVAKEEIQEKKLKLQEKITKEKSDE